MNLFKKVEMFYPFYKQHIIHIKKKLYKIIILIIKIKIKMKLKKKKKKLKNI